jgi:mono/diheme cytochrome c family protein
MYPLRSVKMSFPAARFSPFGRAVLGFVVAGMNLVHADEIASSHAARMAESASLFKEKIGLLLSEHCLGCHGGEKTKSGFNLANRTRAMEGGDQGVAIVPGKPEHSPLLDYVTHREEPYMPPKKPMLPAEAIATIEHWIQLGAAYDEPLLEGNADDTAPMTVDAGDRDYWAYRPLEPPPSPAPPAP